MREKPSLRTSSRDKLESASVWNTRLEAWPSQCVPGQSETVTHVSHKLQDVNYAAFTAP